MRHLASILSLWTLGCKPVPDPPPGVLPSADSGEPATCEAHRLVLSQSFDDTTLPTRASPSKSWPGVAVGDFDGDDWPDVLMAYGGGSTLMRNDGTGRLIQDDAATADGEPLPRARSVAAADIDGDGDLDAFLGLYESGREQLVLRNDGTGHFTREPIAGSTAIPWGASFADLDGDGRIDLYIATYDAPHDAETIMAGEAEGSGHAVYTQRADGSFQALPGAIPDAVQAGLSLQGALVDYDLDGDLDLYMTNDFGPFVLPNKMLENDGTGHFSVVDDCYCDLAMYAMGTGVGDPDNDGDPDLFISNVGSPVYLENQGDGTFADATRASGGYIEPTPENMTSWATTFFDADQDGCEDVLVVYGRLNSEGQLILDHESDGAWSEAEDQPDVLLRGDCAGGFTRAPAEDFADPGRARAMAIGDLDRDGRPDVITAGKHYLNVWLAEGGCAPGLRITLDAGPGNRQGFGAKVEVLGAEGTQTRWMRTDTTASSSEAALYVGLGTASHARSVVVTWPDGTREQVDDVPAGTPLHIEQGVGVVAR